MITIFVDFARLFIKFTNLLSRANFICFVSVSGSIINGLSPEIMKHVFPLKESYEYCSRFPFKTVNINAVSYGTETLSFIGPKIWALVPNDLRKGKIPP